VATTTAAGAVSFAVTKRVRFGQSLRVVGSVPQLGDWDPSRAPELVWSEGDVWTGEVALPPGAEAAYKFVVVGGEADAEWEEGDDRRVTGGDAPAVVTADFGKRAGADKPREKERSRDKEKERKKSRDSPPDDPAAPRVAPTDELVLAMAGADGRWQGKEVTFMRSNDHSGSRRGGHKPDGLAGGAKALVEGDMCAAAQPHPLSAAVLGLRRRR
jgi:hypothetical protein